MQENKTGTAYDAALAAATDDTERARLAQLRIENNLAADSPEFVFYATLAPIIGTVQSNAAASDRNTKQMQSLAADIAATNDALRAVGARPERTSLIVQPSGAASLWALATAALVLVALLVTWAGTQSYDAARYASESPRITALIDTPGGRAAMKILRENGDALVPELSNTCKHFASGGREAMTCTIWASGGNSTTILTPGARIADILVTFPAWPIVTFAVALAALIYLVRLLRQQRKKK